MEAAPMNLAASHFQEPDEYHQDAAEQRLVLIHRSDEPAPFQPVQLRAERAAHQIGLQATEIERLPFDLFTLEEEGAFVNVDASNFGLLDRRLDWRALGVTPPGPEISLSGRRGVDWCRTVIDCHS
jgi:hypothetical protein